MVLDSDHRLVGDCLSEADLCVLPVVLDGPSSSVVLTATAPIEDDPAKRT